MLMGNTFPSYERLSETTFSFSDELARPLSKILRMCAAVTFTRLHWGSTSAPHAPKLLKNDSVQSSPLQ